MTAETVKAWAIVAAMAMGVLLLIFFSLPPLLDHWDKARAKTRIEVRDMEAVAGLFRGHRPVYGSGIPGEVYPANKPQLER